MQDNLPPPPRSGDMVEIAIWMTGTERPEEIQHWKDVVCANTAAATEREHNVTIGPWRFEEKKPGDDRVPQVPDHIHGPDVRLLVAEAKVGPGRETMVVDRGFVHDLTDKDLRMLRRITRKAYFQAVPGGYLSNRQCDAVINWMGPEVAVRTLRRGASVQ